MITRELVELKHKVLLERIDRLYNIFIVISQDEKHITKLNAIKVIKEQYEKMYQAILQGEEYDKYEDVENTIMTKIAQIEHHLDLHIYRTFGNCEELFDRYIKEIEKYDNYNNLDGELDKIKALKAMLKLYSSYISQELKETLAQKISAIKLEILLRKQIKDMDLQLNSESLNLLEQYDTKEEREIFENLVRERFKWYIDRQISPDMKEREVDLVNKKNTKWMMELIDFRNVLLQEEIKMHMKAYKVRFEKAHAFMRILYKTEKINKKIDTTEILNMQEQIKKLQEQLDEAFANNQYNKYLEIRANITPKLEEFERRIDEIGGLDYIFDTINSRQYFIKALLEQNEESPRVTLEYVVGLYYPDKCLEDNERYKTAVNDYKSRVEIRRIIAGNGGDLRCRNYLAKYPELKQLFEVPIFNNTVLKYEEEFNKFRFVGCTYAKFEYLRDLTNGNFSLFDWMAFGNIYDDDYTPRGGVYQNYMNYSQKLVWKFYQRTKFLIGEKPPYVYYLIQLDEEVEIDSDLSRVIHNFWPIGGEEFYKVVNFYDVPYTSMGGATNITDLERLYFKTKQLLIKKREIKLPLDETKMKKLSNEEAEELKQTVKKGSLEDNVDNIIKNIFDLWPETEENKQRREAVRKSIKKELIKMGTENYLKLRIQKIECHELYESIKNEIQRTMTSFSGYKNFQSETEKVVHLISFIYEFLEPEDDFREFGGQVEFDLLLRRQIEKILYKNGGKGNRSEFDSYRALCISFFGQNGFHFGEKLSKYLGIERRIDYKIVDDNDKVNEILLKDMNARPGKYLFVLDVPEENSIVPKETRDKIAECARQIEFEESELSER